MIRFSRLLMKIKNWRLNEEYKYLKEEKNPHIWAWEFLRRNKQYQDDWIKHQDLKSQYVLKYGDYWEENDKTQIYEPAKLKNESRGQWVKRVLDTSIEEPISYSLSKYYSKKWFLKSLSPHNPLTDLNQKIIFNRKHFNFPEEIKYPFDTKRYVLNQEEGLSEYEFLSTDEIHPDKLILVFDTNHSMDEQLIRAREIFKKKHTPKKSKHNLTEKHLEYIRLIDAFEDLHTDTKKWNKIASILCAEEENEYPDYKASKRLMSLYKKAKKNLEYPYSVL